MRDAYQYDTTCERCGTDAGASIVKRIGGVVCQGAREIDNGVHGVITIPCGMTVYARQVRCGAVKPGTKSTVCDRPAGHDGHHGGYSQSNRSPGYKTWEV